MATTLVRSLTTRQFHSSKKAQICLEFIFSVTSDLFRCLNNQIII